MNATIGGKILSEELDVDKVPGWKKFSTWSVLIGLMAFVMSFILPFYLDDEYLDKAGSLLAGSSFLIIFAGILMQGDELKLQRRESKRQREELALQREQLEYQAKELEATRGVFETQNYNQLLQSTENTLLNLMNAKDEIVRNFPYDGKLGISALRTLNNTLTDPYREISYEGVPYGEFKDYHFSLYQLVINRINYMYIYLKESNINEVDKTKYRNLIFEHLNIVEKDTIVIFFNEYNTIEHQYGNLESISKDIERDRSKN